MTEAEFNSQIDRLISNFGKNAFSPERAILIWREVRDYSKEWFVRTCDRFIGDSKLPPLLPEFREAISRERERLWAQEKKKEHEEATEFVRSVFEPEDVRHIVQTMIRRVSGGMSDQDWSAHLRVVESTVNRGRKSQ